jgi:hypothetical protein
MVGTFTMFEIPSGNPTNGLGVGKGWAKLPVWAQKSFGPWTTYGGVGENINTAQGYRNFTYAGWRVQRDIVKKWTLGTELFSHGREGIATAQSRAAAFVDIGGYHYFRNPGFQLLFCYGHSGVGQSENYAYLGLGAAKRAAIETRPKAPKASQSSCPIPDRRTSDSYFGCSACI